MGIVYDAITKSRWDQRPSAARAVEVDDRKPDAASADQDSDFDFVRYSLSTPAVEELERIQADQEAEADARRMEAKPGREVEVSLSQIDPHLVRFYDCDPRASDEYKRLANSVIAAAGEREIKRLLIASAKHGDGRTLVTLNLACALSAARKRVLVVDADFKRPSILRLLGIQAEVGVAEALAQCLPAGAATVKVKPHGFVVLPARDRLDNSAEILSSRALEELLRSLEDDYDFILFDSAPLLDSDDKDLLAQMTNAALLVVRPERVGAAELGSAILPFTQDRILGVVMNRVS